jgi:hypothetical protein
MDAFRRQIEIKKAELDRLRPLASKGLGSLEHYYDLELTYTSNAIEGNTVSSFVSRRNSVWTPLWDLKTFPRRSKMGAWAMWKPAR